MNCFWKCAAGCILFAAGLWSLADEWSQPILKDHRQIGVVLRNTYSYVGFVNPDEHTGNFLFGDFKVLPRVMDNGTKTLDEEEALPRFFTRLTCRVASGGKYGRPVKANGTWNFQQLANGVEGVCQFGSENQLAAKLSGVLSPDKASMTVSAEFTNQGQEPLTAYFEPQFAMLIQELEPIKLMVPQEITRFQTTGKLQFWRTDVTELNGNYKNYWWRKAAESDKQLQGRNLQLEKITFGSPKLVSPKFFGVYELRGRNAMVWDLADAPEIAELELRWQKDLVRVMPVWKLDVPAGESKKITFRLIFVKNIVRIDTIQGDWLFGYQTRKDMLRIQFMPLMPHERLMVNMGLTSPKGDTLSGKPSEAPRMNPAQPGKIDYRLSMPLQDGGRYPIKISLSDLQDNSRVAEVDGLVTP